MGTQAVHLDGPPADGKTRFRRAVADGVVDADIVEFRRRATGRAEEKLPAVGKFGIAAADEAVEALDAVHETLRGKEIQGPVNRRRRRAPALPPQGVQDVVGAEGPVAAPHQLENPPAQIGQARTAPFADGRRPLQGPVRAVAVIVVLGRKAFIR